jgi:hypothetical protein
MNDTRRLAYSLVAGMAISGLIFWLSFWHGRVLLGTAAGLVLVILYWVRSGGTKQWQEIHRHGTRREIRRYEITVAILVLFVIGLCIFTAIYGEVPP